MPANNLDVVAVYSETMYYKITFNTEWRKPSNFSQTGSDYSITTASINPVYVKAGDELDLSSYNATIVKKTQKGLIFKTTYTYTFQVDYWSTSTSTSGKISGQKLTNVQSNRTVYAIWKKVS